MESKDAHNAHGSKLDELEIDFCSGDFLKYVKIKIGMY
jgi:hypothetical protein